ncbi:MAG: hypothetical protein ABMB14_14735 [Myxococcota bacterium]
MDPALPVGRPLDLERGRAVDQRPEQAPGRVQVGPRADVAPAAAELLRRHVRRGAPADRVPAAVGLLGEPEVVELDPRHAAGPGDEHVRRLEVAVDHAAGVGVAERVEQRDDHRLDRRPRQAAAPAGQRAAVDPLHREPRGARRDRTVGAGLGPGVGLAVVEHPDDVRVVEGGDRPGLGAERLAPGGLVVGLGGQELHRHGVLQAQVSAGPHLAHAALADRTVQTERAQLDHRSPPCDLYNVARPGAARG